VPRGGAGEVVDATDKADFRQVRRVDRVSGASSVLVNRNALGNTGGLTFASDGSLLVASTDFFNIQRFDAASGALLGNFVTGVTAYGLAFGSDNILYVSTGSSNSILLPGR
jgi:outer membrane protein assembly factor BamB